MYGDIWLRDELFRLVSLKVPDVNNARLVSDNKFLHNIIISSETETDSGQPGYLLVGMEVDTVDWTIGLVMFQHNSYTNSGIMVLMMTMMLVLMKTML